MDYGMIISVVLVVTALVWILFIKPYMKDNNVLTLEQLEFIDYATSKAVKYAEQTYKTDNTVDRKQLALDYAVEIVKKADIIPIDYLTIIKGMIEANVLNLPKTNK